MTRDPIFGTHPGVRLREERRLGRVVWDVEFYDEGRRQSVSSAGEDRSRARKMAAEFARKHDAVVVLCDPSPINRESACDLF